MSGMQRTPAVTGGIILAILAAAVVVFLLVSGVPAEPAPPPSTEPSPPATTPSPSAATSASAGASLSAELLDRRWTVVLVGLDTDSSRSSRGEPVNADALMLVSLSADQSELALVSLPRDTVDVPRPDGTTHTGKINGLYGSEGLDALVGAIGELYAVPVDGHLAVNMDDFAAVVNAVGGVDVDAEQAIVDPSVRLDIPAGPQTLDGSKAEGYVRTRFDQDYGRMRRQQEVLIGVLERLADPEADLDLATLLDELDSLETDLPIDELPTLLELARRATDATVRELIIAPPLITFEGDRGDGRGYILEPDVEAIRAAVADLIGPDE
jgi:LCP family protein required for cell wall assembly